MFVQWWKRKDKLLYPCENSSLIVKIRNQKFSSWIVLFSNSWELDMKHVSFFLWEAVDLTRQWWCPGPCSFCSLEYDLRQVMMLVLPQLLLCRMKMLTVSSLRIYGKVPWDIQMLSLQFCFPCSLWLKLPPNFSKKVWTRHSTKVLILIKYYFYIKWLHVLCSFYSVDIKELNSNCFMSGRGRDSLPGPQQRCLSAGPG